MNRVVITGLGVVAPNGINIPSFTNALKNGISGIQFFQHLKDSAMGCCVAGIPKDFDEMVLKNYLSPGAFKSLRSTTIKYALAATIEAWTSAGLSLSRNTPDADTGCIFGNGVCDVDHMRYAISMYENFEIQKLSLIHISEPTRRTPISYAV